MPTCFSGAACCGGGMGLSAVKSALLMIWRLCLAREDEGLASPIWRFRLRNIISISNFRFSFSLSWE